MKKILIPTDLSELGDYAYSIASILAKQTQATIDVLSVISGPQDAIYDVDNNLKKYEGEDYSGFYKQRDELNLKLKKWCENKSNIGQCTAKIGRVEIDILHYAHENDIDLIIMGTHGATGFRQLIYGSHTEHITNKSTIPVLSLKCDRSDLKLDKIVLASDFQDSKKIDLNVLKTIQDAFNSTLVLLRINTTHDFESQDLTQKHMTKFVELNELSNVEFSTFNALSVEEGLVAFCDENNIDLIALGTHQKKAIFKLFRENISDDVINHIYHPVLSFPIR